VQNRLESGPTALNSAVLALIQDIRRNQPRSLPTDDGIITTLRRVSAERPNYWEFRTTAQDLASHGLFQYPAMMVPEMQKQVITAILSAHQKVELFADPFMGSGTILALAMLNGREFVGQDINPLSILIGKTRAFSLNSKCLTEAVNVVYARARLSISRRYGVRFGRQAKWFTRGANIGLSRLRAAIRKEKSIHARRFLWVCLAETVRLNSNSRTSTYKLHIKPKRERNAAAANVFDSFITIGYQNIAIVEEFCRALQRLGYLNSRGHYKYPISIQYGDSARRFPKSGKNPNVVITSPPYGDNRTTVPYGQAAWLSLQWIDMQDISGHIPGNIAEGMYDIDSRSLGGRRPRNLAVRRSIIAPQGSIVSNYANKLAHVSREGLSRFVHFVYDLRRALRQIANGCEQGGYVVITLGERNISGTVCPLADICTELLEDSGLRAITHIERRIPSKRMPKKNGHSPTITREFISIFRKRKSPKPRIS
jgi:DNA methylase